MNSKQKQVGIVGLGRIGKCLLKGLLHSGFDKKTLSFTTAHEESRLAAESEFGIKGCQSNVELVKRSSVIVLSTKPQNLLQALEEIGSSKKADSKLWISVAASYSTVEIEKKLGACKIVRAMPNTPIMVRNGITALCAGSTCEPEDLDTAFTIFKPLGAVKWVDESQMEAVTGLSGCGPAYFYLILEALVEGGIKVGLPRDLALSLAAETMLGSAKMILETQKHPAALRDEVTTPAGCTIEGLMALEEGRIRITLANAVTRATERAKTLAQGRG